MGCGRSNDVGSSGCVCEVVRAILDIQNQAVDDDCSTCTTNCFLEPLGGIVSPARPSADTRVFTLSTKSGVPFISTFSSDIYDDVCISVYFRVEDVFDGCCATLRVLVPLDENGNAVDLTNGDSTISLSALCDVVDFAASDSCITVDLDCFCAVQCIADVDLGICN
ncbi:MAG: CotY/CotZ family spore coat protein [Lysinibacillus sp.]